MHGESTGRGVRAAQTGVLVNAGLAVVKLLAGIFGHTYALIADAVESGADVLGSLIVWGGLAVAARPPDEDHPFGHGKAEALAALAVALMLLAAAAGIAFEAAREIRTPHQVPAPWTLGVLVAVIVVKGALSRRVGRVGSAIGSTAVRADAWHHLSDALTSAGGLHRHQHRAMGEPLSRGHGLGVCRRLGGTGGVSRDSLERRAAYASCVA